MISTAKIVSIQSVEKREMVFLDAEDKETEVWIQTDAGKVELWEWIDRKENESFIQGSKQATYLWVTILVITFSVLFQAYFITFFYRTEEYLRLEGIRYEIMLREKRLDLTPHHTYGP